MTSQRAQPGGTTPAGPLSGTGASTETPEVSVVIPAYRCEACLVELHRRLVAVFEQLAVPFEIVFVNDASPEGDWKVIRELAARDPRVKGVNLSRNFGQHFAIRAGIDCVSGNWVVVMDGDLQDPPEAIAVMYRKVLEGHDVVFGRKPRRAHGFFKRLTSRLFTWLLSYLMDARLDNAVTHFSIVSRVVVQNLRRFRERDGHYAYFVGWLGFDVAYVDVDHQPRFAGKSSYTLGRLLKLAFNMVVSQSDKPLRASIVFGFGIAAMAFLRGVYDIWRYLYAGVPPQGWTSLMVSVYFLGGLLFVALGVLGLYIGRIFEETKGRPFYVVKESINVSPPWST